MDERSAELTVGGDNRVAAQYVVLLTKKHPSEMVREFYSEASPRAAAAVSEAVSSLVGKLDGEWMTTAKQIADLCFRLQMTGYMLRNAEYAVALRDILNVDAPSRRELKRAFDDVDTNKDGFLTFQEVDRLFDSIYDGTNKKKDEEETQKKKKKKSRGVEAPPPKVEDEKKKKDPDAELKKQKEARSFIKYFDSDGDGKISFEEFCTGLGGSTVGSVAPLNDSDDADDAPPDLPRLPISGTIDLVFPNGKTQKVDAQEYVTELRREAEALREAIASARESDSTALAQVTKRQPEKTSLLSTYVETLSEDSKKVLTDTLTPDAKAAMSQLISFILAGGDAKDKPIPAEATLKIEQRFLRELMQLQLITGYRIRELEALEVAEERAGRT